MLFQFLLLSLFTNLLPVSAHYSLNYPAPRVSSADNQAEGPCGGSDSPSSERTYVSTSSLPIYLNMGHDERAVQILLGLGDNPGNNFNITLVPTFRQEGLGDFCLDDIPLPTDVGIVDGANATLQVVTSGDPTGGLYACADITFKSDAVTPPSSCTNGTAVTSRPFSSEGAARNANESTPQGEPQAGSSTESGSATSSETGATSTPTGGAAGATARWGILGFAVIAAVGLL